MSLIICRDCNQQISSTAKSCPHCGAKNRHIGWTGWTAVALCVGAVFFFCKLVVMSSSVPPVAPAKQKQNLSSAVSYLSKIEEVRWLTIDKNNIYIGFNPVPDDMRGICNAAAINGNRKTNFGVHVWAVDASKHHKNWRPITGKCLYETTARYGKLEN
jgi:hypothetical protein